MIKIWTSEKMFDYDIHALIRAFFPGEEVLIGCEESYRDDQNMRIEIDYQEKDEIMTIEVSIISDTLSKSLRDSAKNEELEADTRRARRNILKRMIYHLLREYTGEDLPWGTLTGIRPVKLPMQELMKQEFITREYEDDLLEQMKEKYLISDEKGRTSIEIAKEEIGILNQTHRLNGHSIYIGIPFCPTTCLYCSFTSYPIQKYKDKVAAYLAALEKELYAVANLKKDSYLDTVYIGGGTPTTLAAEELEFLLERVTSILDFTYVKEFMVEAGRADSITREKLEVMKKYHVTRISINPQTMNDKTLKLIGRRHTVQQVEDAFYLARELGFDHINMDIILGLPGETIEDVKVTLDKIVEMNPDSLTVHSLAIKRASRLREVLEEEGTKPIIHSTEIMELANQAAREMKMKPYYLYRQKNMAGNQENIGYGRDGKYGIYNVLIMEDVHDIVAVGAGTVSKAIFDDDLIERCDCVKDVDLYIERIDEMIERKRKLFSPL